MTGRFDSRRLPEALRAIGCSEDGAIIAIDAEVICPPSVAQCPPSRKIARRMFSGRHHLSKAVSIFVARVEHALPRLAQDCRLLDAFTSMVRHGEEDGLTDWLDQAKTSGMAAFARSLGIDLKAIAAALRASGSNGQTAGQINRLKMLKRQMYGTAGIERLQHSARRCHGRR